MASLGRNGFSRANITDPCRVEIIVGNIKINLFAFSIIFWYWDSIGKQNHLLWKNGPVNLASKLICDYISWNIGMSHFTLVRSLLIVRAHCNTVMTHECTGISNHLPLDCLFNSWLRIISKNQMYKSLDFCEEKSLVTGGFPSQRASNVESICMSWCHHDEFLWGIFQVVAL